MGFRNQPADVYNPRAINPKFKCPAPAAAARTATKILKILNWNKLPLVHTYRLGLQRDH